MGRMGPMGPMVPMSSVGPMGPMGSRAHWPMAPGYGNEDPSSLGLGPGPVLWGGRPQQNYILEQT